MTKKPNACKSCNAAISAKAFDCPRCGHPQRKPKRGFFGFVFKWVFIAFNLFMVAWVIAAIFVVSEGPAATSSAEMVGAAIGTGLGFGLIATIWVLGDIILGIFVLFTRPRK